VVLEYEYLVIRLLYANSLSSHLIALFHTPTAAPSSRLLTENHLSSRDYPCSVSHHHSLHNGTDSEIAQLLTINTGVVRLNKGLLDLSILHQQSIALAAVVTKDGNAVEAQVKSLGELAGGVAEEANLYQVVHVSTSIGSLRG
jgi:hypothetical protein